MTPIWCLLLLLQFPALHANVLPDPKSLDRNDDGGNDSEVDPIENLRLNQAELLKRGIKLIEGDEVQVPGDSEDLDENGDYVEVWIPRRRWTGGVVPYTYRDHFDNEDKRVIEDALDSLNRKLGSSCVQFRPRQSEENYVYIVKMNGCFSAVGMVGGGQRLSLGNRCVTNGVVQHEFLHALGILHEQSRSDRDDYINLYPENMIQGTEYAFGKMGQHSQYGQSVAYDYNSIMHYGSDAFSKNGHYTISKKTGDFIHANRKEVTEQDLKKIRIMYQCSGGGGGGGTDVNCQDSQENCAGWAQAGYCTKSQTWMSEHCKKSCGKCGGGSGCKYEDKRNDCLSYKSYCTDNQYVDWMKKNCAKTCQC